MPRERPPFWALNFRSGAYNFHKWTKTPLRSITILQFMPFRRPSFSKFLYFQPIHRRPLPAYWSQPEQRSESAPRLAAGQSASSGDPHFHARARSGAPHFHALPGARAGPEPPFFYFAVAHTYQNLGRVYPPPPRTVLVITTSKTTKGCLCQKGEKCSVIAKGNLSKLTETAGLQGSVYAADKSQHGG